jgi:choline dehydrogenase-like flavoprotein
MGPDPEAVLDPDLCVRGVRGLRVIDASVMPVICSCDTVGAAMMTGERGADLTPGAAKGSQCLLGQHHHRRLIRTPAGSPGHPARNERERSTSRPPQRRGTG